MDTAELTKTCRSLAAQYLERREYEILNVTDDGIITAKQDALVIFAVVTAGSTDTPAPNCDAQLLEAKKSCLEYLCDNLLDDVMVRLDRIDVVITGPKKADLHHLMGAWHFPAA